jgi:hypothetical protein
LRASDSSGHRINHSHTIPVRACRAGDGDINLLLLRIPHQIIALDIEYVQAAGSWRQSHRKRKGIGCAAAGSWSLDGDLGGTHRGKIGGRNLRLKLCRTAYSRRQRASIPLHNRISDKICSGERKGNRRAAGYSARWRKSCQRRQGIGIHGKWKRVGYAACRCRVQNRDAYSPGACEIRCGDGRLQGSPALVSRAECGAIPLNLRRGDKACPGHRQSQGAVASDRRRWR